MKDIIVKIKHALVKKYVFDQPGEVTRSPLADVAILLQEINTIQLGKKILSTHRDELEKSIDRICGESDIKDKRISELYDSIEEWIHNLMHVQNASEVVKNMKSILKGTK